MIAQRLKEYALSKDMRNVGIVIPAHNEGKRISATLQAYGAYFEKLRKQKKLDYTLLIVVNASKAHLLSVTNYIP